MVIIVLLIVLLISVTIGAELGLKVSESVFSSCSEKVKTHVFNFFLFGFIIGGIFAMEYVYVEILDKYSPIEYVFGIIGADVKSPFGGAEEQGYTHTSTSENTVESNSSHDSTSAGAAEPERDEINHSGEETETAITWKFTDDFTIQLTPHGNVIWVLDVGEHHTVNYTYTGNDTMVWTMQPGEKPYDFELVWGVDFDNNQKTMILECQDALIDNISPFYDPDSFSNIHLDIPNEYDNLFFLTWLTVCAHSNEQLANSQNLDHWDLEFTKQ